MLFRAAVLALIGASLLLAACDDGPTYSTNRADEDYDLEAMLLRNVDLPEGMDSRFQQGFDNEEWALASADEDPEATAQALENWRRVRNHLAIFARDDPGEFPAKPLNVLSQSTLYKDNEAASRAITDPRQSCGTTAADSKDIATDFIVPKIGEQSIGFSVVQQTEAGSIVNTTVCFRTGRIVHAVVQTGFNGSQDLGLNVRLAQRQLERVERTLAGKPDPKETPADEG